MPEAPRAAAMLKVERFPLFLQCLGINVVSGRTGLEPDHACSINRRLPAALGPWQFVPCCIDLSILKVCKLF